MSALDTRAEVQAHQHFYLTPLAQVGKVPEQLETWVQAAVSGQVPLVTLHAEEGTTVVGQAYELTRTQTRPPAEGVAGVNWTERVLIVRSEALVQAGQRGLAQRLQRAETALKALTPPRGRGQRQYTEEAPLREAVETLLTRYELHGLLTVAVHEQVERKTVHGYRGQPGRVEERRRYRVRVWRNQAALEAYERRLGWRAYVTNVPAKDLPLTEAVQVYWDEWLIERDMARLKGRPLSLAPVWVTREDHALGLTRVLTLALRVLAVAEYQVRRQLAERRQELRGLYPGQPQRSTTQPTTERLLKAFGNITLTRLRQGQQMQWHLTPLSPLQKDILNLLGCPRELYQPLVHDSG
jgi:transposase